MPLPAQAASVAASVAARAMEGIGAWRVTGNPLLV